MGTRHFVYLSNVDVDDKQGKTVAPIVGLSEVLSGILNCSDLVYNILVALLKFLKRGRTFI